MNIDINGVKITLTKEQLKQINDQISIIYKVEDINSLEIAEKILENTNHTRFYEKHFTRMKDWISYQLETIIKATNFIDNDNKIWETDWNNRQSSKYLPYFEKSSGSWFFFFVTDYGWHTYAPGCIYYKNNKSANIISKKFIHLHNEYLG